MPSEGLGRGLTEVSLFVMPHQSVGERLVRGVGRQADLRAVQLVVVAPVLEYVFVIPEQLDEARRWLDENIRGILEATVEEDA
jgi:hypothetical protein